MSSLTRQTCRRHNKAETRRQVSEAPHDAARERQPSPRGAARRSLWIPQERTEIMQVASTQKHGRSLQRRLIGDTKASSWQGIRWPKEPRRRRRRRRSAKTADTLANNAWNQAQRGGGIQRPGQPRCFQSPAGAEREYVPRPPGGRTLRPAAPGRRGAARPATH